jgi:ketosteroid isomerase-like protein
VPTGIRSGWVERVYTAVDRKDADGFAAAFNDDAWFRFGNWPPVTGRDAIREVVADFFAGIGGLRHDFTAEWRDGDTLILPADVTYTRTDGTTVTVPAVTVFDLDGPLARRCQIYVDLAPLFAPA